MVIDSPGPPGLPDEIAAETKGWPDAATSPARLPRCPTRLPGYRTRFDRSCIG